MEGFQEAALQRVNICSALGLGQPVTACGPSHSSHRTPISGTFPSTWGTAPDLGSALLSSLPPSFIPRLETGPGREWVSGMPQSSPRLLSCCSQVGGR